MTDPLVMDVLCDDRTFPLGYGKFVRAGVIYQFTDEEIQEANRALFTKVAHQIQHLLRPLSPHHGGSDARLRQEK